MAVTSWMLRERTFRSGRSLSRNKSEIEEDTVDLDASKDATENAYEILSNVCKKQGLTDTRRLGYLNIFTKLIEKINASDEEFHMSKEDVLCCLKVGLVSDNTLIRAGGFRVIRYFINRPDDVVLLNKLQIPNLITRSIDLVLRNDHERIQAFRLALKILNLCPKYFSATVTRSLVSLANSISENKDRMSNSCLAILCQLCVLNPELLLECNGQTAILRSTLEISHARINECLVGCLLFLMNKPETRNKANIQLEYLTSIYCDWQRNRTKKDQNSTYTSSMLSILAALRTWTGVFHLCQPNNVSGMKALIDVLYLNQFEVRKAILELLFELFGLDHEDWTDEIVTAIRNIDPSKYQDLWSLNDKFVAAEGKDILPHKAVSRPNLTEVHTALIVYSLLECGLLSALVEVIITTDAILSVQAVILLGFILHLSHKLLPPEIIELSPGLPTLVHYAANGLPRERNQALMAVSSLCRIHELFKNRPAPFSLFLNQILSHSNWCKNKGIQSSEETFLKPVKSARKKTGGMQIKNVEDHLKDSRVLSCPDPKKWCWDHIATSLKCQSESFIKLEDVQHKNYIRRLMTFYKPSSDEYSIIKYSYKTQEDNLYTTTSFSLLNFLLRTEEGEPQKILLEFLTDLHGKLREIITHSNIHEILFSPQHLNSSLCQHYFLMVGCLSSSENGIRVLEKTKILQTLLEIVETFKHESYVKLILSSLNYNSSSTTRRDSSFTSLRSGGSEDLQTTSMWIGLLFEEGFNSFCSFLLRITSLQKEKKAAQSFSVDWIAIAIMILNKAMTSSVDNVRMFATELLLVLARSDVNNFSKWGLDLLIGQMYDENKVIATASINILHELSYDQEYLEVLINTRPSLLHLGDKGHLLLIRFLSTTSGFVFLSDANFVQNELENWEKGYNYRYVGLMEGDLHDCLTLHQRNEDGKYSRRYAHNKHRWKDVFVYPHLYGELSQHEKGFQALIHNGFIFKMIQTIQNGYCSTDAEIMELKSSLWGLSNMATSVLGLQLLEQENLIQNIVRIAQSCPVLTVRATAFYSICLISTTVGGANALVKHGWYSVRHSRCEKWPVIETDYLLLEEVSDLKNQDDFESISSVTYESDETDSVMFDAQKSPYDLKSPLFKVKKASTLPTGLVPNFDEKHGFERRSTMESQSSDGSDDVIKSPGIPIFRKHHQRSFSESFHGKKRHSSENSYEGNEVNQKLSFQDAVGLATLQSLHSYRRPDVISGINSELEQPEFRKRFSSQDRASSSPMSDFEAHNPPKLFSNTSSSSLSSVSQRTPTETPKSGSKTSNFSYQGISLPKALADFLIITKTTNERREERKGPRKRGSHSFSEMEQVKELEEEEVEGDEEGDDDNDEDDLVTSSSSEKSDSEESSKTTSKKTREGQQRVRHNPAACIACCMRVCRGKRQRKISSGSYRVRTDTDSSYGNPNDSSPVQAKWRLRTQSENAFSNFTCGSGDSLSNTESRKERGDAFQITETEQDDSSGSAHTIHNEIISHTKVRRDVLKYVNRMCNPVWAKASEQSLLRLKQSHPAVFKDPCLYSSVCNILSNSACRVTARRFIQELFLDVSFNKILDDAANILQKYAPTSTVSGANPGGDVSTYPSSPSSIHLPLATETEGDTTLPKTLMPKSKCTSPNNLTTLFENVPSSRFDLFNNDQAPSIQNSSSQLRSNCSERIPNS